MKRLLPTPMLSVALFVMWLLLNQSLSPGHLLLALVFALIDTPDSGGVIHEDELIRALAWGDYLRSHANRLYAAAVMPETTDAASLLAKIKAGGFEGKFDRAAEIFTQMSTQDAFEEFLTLPLYEEI